MEQTEQDIQELVRSAQSGNVDSTAALFDTFSGRIYRFLRLRLPDDPTAEDLTQTVFLEMLRSLKRYRPGRAKFSTWLFQIARFRLIDHYRRQPPPARLDDAAERLPHGPAAADAQADRLDLGDALARLPERYRTVLELRFHEGFSPTEVARIMRTTAINVRVLQYRALRALRSLIA